MPEQRTGTQGTISSRAEGFRAGGNCLADQAGDGMASVHPGLVGVEHDWNLARHGESRLKAATHVGPAAHLDPVVPARRPCSFILELRLRYGIVCQTQVAAGIPPRVWPDGPGKLTVGRHSRDAQVEVGLARGLAAGVDPQERPVGDAFARLTSRR